MNKFQEGLGTAFASNKLDFEFESTDINDHGAFFKMLRDDCSFLIKGPRTGREEMKRTRTNTLPKQLKMNVKPKVAF